jgi:hypothetical protein
VFVNQPFHFPYRMCRNGTISGQGDGIQPELALAICTTDVNVRRLDALVRVKVKTKSADSEYRWHPSKVWPLGHVGKFCSGQGGDVTAIPVRQCSSRRPASPCHLSPTSLFTSPFLRNTDNVGQSRQSERSYSGSFLRRMSHRLAWSHTDSAARLRPFRFRRRPRRRLRSPARATCPAS